MDEPRLRSAVDAAMERLEAQRLDAPSGSGQAADLDPLADGLFPPTPGERLDMLGAFVRTEREPRADMLVRHQDRRDYWQRRIADADEALHHVEQLRKELL
ncbi:MAG: hypothetical protein BWY94_02410 [Actinobacteria bacterium ADurb.BinA094]|nr:MAG: hypothetical protein BWY94_02410 [Actinobacteria bacterium ADurb.BinA094]